MISVLKRCSVITVIESERVVELWHPQAAVVAGVSAVGVDFNRELLTVCDDCGVLGALGLLDGAPDGVVVLVLRLRCVDGQCVVDANAFARSKL